MSRHYQKSTEELAADWDQFENAAQLGYDLWMAHMQEQAEEEHKKRNP